MGRKKKNVSITRNQKKNVLVLFDTDRSYRRGMLQGISNYFNTHRQWNVHLSHPLTTPKVFQLIESWKPDGLIYETPPLKSLDKLSSLKIPVVVQMPTDNKYENLSSIIPDDFNIGKIAAKYFIQKGFKSYAFCGYLNRPYNYYLTWSGKRYNGFCQTLRTEGFNVSIYEQDYIKSLRIQTKELMRIANWLKGLVRPVAVFACNDIRACDVLEACKLGHLEVPDEVAVLGVDNDEITCNFFNPPISSIILNAEQAGYKAAELLQKMMCDQEIGSKRIIIHPQYVVERQSTDIFVIDDEEVQKAIRFIHNNCMSPLCNSDVAQAVCLSVRTLDRRFKKVLGRPVHKAITRIRMKRVCDLLGDANLTIVEIAEKMGFSDPQNLSRTFKREMGVGPLIYRENSGKLQS